MGALRDDLGFLRGFWGRGGDWGFLGEANGVKSF